MLNKRKIVVLIRYIWLIYAFSLHIVTLLLFICLIHNGKSFEMVQLKDSLDFFHVNFDIHKDILAFMHIQKTGGSYWENYIYENMLMPSSSVNGTWTKVCQFTRLRYVQKELIKQYKCFMNHERRAIFLNRGDIRHFCDIHADFTELNNCIMNLNDNRLPRLFNRYIKEYSGAIHFMTFLRDPIERYISEFKHVQKGAKWTYAVRKCKKQVIYSRTCYNGENTWQSVDFNEFLTCEYNLANNRQVRMLANYNQLGCDSLKCLTKSENCSIELKKFYENRLLYSAKHTLLSMSFYGLTEYQQQSQYLFENTFKDTFKFALPVNNTKPNNDYRKNYENYIPKIIEINKLDIKLYEFAKKIFFDRVKFYTNKILKL